ncbi:MAG: demethoxyubiquinone hydroxylase family protein, partial [Pseudomonadota bacterium]
MEGPRYIPGDVVTPDDLAGALRVDHAGEFGATRIYKGQWAACKDPHARNLIAHMGAQEEVHLQFFAQALPKEEVRPTILHPLWKGLGFLLGYGTAKMGPQAAMACTVAIEETIDAHYQNRIACLSEEHPALAGQLEIFRQEELEHRDTALDEGAEEIPHYSLL